MPEAVVIRDWDLIPDEVDYMHSVCLHCYVSVILAEN